MAYFTRRELIAGLGKGVIASSLIGAMRPAFSIAQVGGPGGEARYLVLIRLVGGLDALEAFPFVDSSASAAIEARRPRIGIPSIAGIIEPSLNIGMHSALAPLLPEFVSGKMKVVYGIGNRSFTSSLNLSHEFAQNFQAAGGGPYEGGLGRGYLASIREVYHLDERQALAIGVSGGPELTHPQVAGRPISVRDLAQLDFTRLDDAFGGQAESNIILAAAQRLRELHAARVGPAGRTAPVVAALDRMQEMTEFFRSINGYQVPGRFEGYTSSSLGNGLLGIAKTIASLDGEGQSRMFLSGYQSAEWDSHNDQQRTVAENLTDLATNVSTFIADLRGLGRGLWERTTVMTTSEFGRRVFENGTGGTDHGTGSASIVLGGRVQGGVYVDPALRTYRWATESYVPVSVHFQNPIAQSLLWLGHDPGLVFNPAHYTRADLELYA